MTLYFNLRSPQLEAQKNRPITSAAQLIAFTSEAPAQSETPPSPWLVLAQAGDAAVLNLDTPSGREQFAAIMSKVPLYRITLELLIDRILMESRSDPIRTKGVRAAFAPEDPPEPVIDGMAQKFGLEGVLNFPVIASRTDIQLLELYLRLYGAATPDNKTPSAHLFPILGSYVGRFIENGDGFEWRGYGWVRLDRVVYDAERLDHDPEITFESYVARGRTAAEALAVADLKPLLAAWIQAERVQRELCRDIDSVLRLPDIRRLPRWIRADVFRILEREAMKQVFAEGIVRQYAELPALRRASILADPINANAKGEVSPIIQQLLNQTLSADARYAGSAEAFALQAERRFTEAEKFFA
ncbi:MAG: hypothetical protein EBQ96_06505 [Proteobacteria bacterium]|nr:hypothetical protein [Pseudomonadota bacterium]